jgi:hypothetical protein
VHRPQMKHSSVSACLRINSVMSAPRCSKRKGSAAENESQVHGDGALMAWQISSHTSKKNPTQPCVVIISGDSDVGKEGNLIFVYHMVSSNRFRRHVMPLRNVTQCDFSDRISVGFSYLGRDI